MDANDAVMAVKVKKLLPKLCEKLNPHVLFTNLTNVLHGGDAETIEKFLEKSIQPDANLVFRIIRVLKRRRSDDWVTYFLQALYDAEEFDLLDLLGATVPQAQTLPSRPRWERPFARASPSSDHTVPWYPPVGTQLSPPSGQYSSFRDTYSHRGTSMSGIPPAHLAEDMRQSGTGSHKAADSSSSFYARADMSGTDSSTPGGPALQQPAITVKELVENASSGYCPGFSQQTGCRPLSGGERQAPGIFAPELSRRPDQPNSDAVNRSRPADRASNQQTLLDDMPRNIRLSLDNNLDSGLASEDFLKRCTEVNKLGDPSPPHQERKEYNVSHPPVQSRSSEEQLQVDADFSMEDLQAEQLGFVPESATERRRTEEIQHCNPPSYESSTGSDSPPESGRSPMVVNISINKLIMSGQGNHVAFGGQNHAKTLLEGTESVTVERAEDAGPRSLGQHAPLPVPPLPSDRHHETRLKRAAAQQAERESSSPALGSGSMPPCRQDFQQAGLGDLPLPPHSQVSDLSGVHVSDASTHHRTHRKTAWPDDYTGATCQDDDHTQPKVVFDAQVSRMRRSWSEEGNLAGKGPDDEKGCCDEKSADDEKGCCDEKSPDDEKGCCDEKSAGDEKDGDKGKEREFRGFPNGHSSASTVPPKHGPRPKALWITRERTEPSLQHCSPPARCSEASAEEPNLPTTLNEAADWSSELPISPTDPAHMTFVKDFCVSETE